MTESNFVFRMEEPYYAQVMEFRDCYSKPLYKDVINVQCIKIWIATVRNVFIMVETFYNNLKKQFGMKKSCNKSYLHLII